MAEELIAENPIQYLETIFSGMVSKLIVAFIIILIGLIVGKIVGKIVQKVLHGLELNKILKKAANVRISVEEITSHFVQYFIYFVFAIIALEKIGIGAIAFNLLIGGVIVLIVLSVFLSIKDFIPNFMAGLFIHQKGFIMVGDKIKVRDMEGKIIHINLVETRIQTKKGDMIYVPNSLLTKSEVIKLKR